MIKNKQHLSKYSKVFGLTSIVLAMIGSGYYFYQSSNNNLFSTHSITAKSPKKKEVLLDLSDIECKNVEVNVDKPDNGYKVYGIQWKNNWKMADFFPLYNWDKVNGNYINNSMWDKYESKKLVRSSCCKNEWTTVLDQYGNAINVPNYNYYKEKYYFFYEHFDKTAAIGNLMVEYLTSEAAKEASKPTTIQTNVWTKYGWRDIMGRNSYVKTEIIELPNGLLRHSYTPIKESSKTSYGVTTGSIPLNTKNLPPNQKSTLEFKLNLKCINPTSRNKVKEIEKTINVDVDGTFHEKEILIKWGTWLEFDANLLNRNASYGDTKGWAVIYPGEYANYKPDKLTLTSKINLKQNGNKIDYKIETTSEAENEGNQNISIYDGTYNINLNEVKLTLSENYKGAAEIDKILKEDFTKCGIILDERSKLSDEKNLKKIQAKIKDKLNHLLNNELQWFKNSQGVLDTNRFTISGIIDPTKNEEQLLQTLKSLVNDETNTVELTAKFYLPLCDCSEDGLHIKTYSFNPTDISQCK